LKLEKQPFQAQNFSDLVRRVQNDPSLARQVYKLQAGSNFSRDETALNDLCERNIVDTDRLYFILHFNSFTSAYNDDTEPKDQHDFLNNQNEGLWLQPAYFNHSCLPNTRTHFFADFMMIYTSNFAIL
jgi:hypothetical protein